MPESSDERYNMADTEKNINGAPAGANQQNRKNNHRHNHHHHSGPRPDKNGVQASNGTEGTVTPAADTAKTQQSKPNNQKNQAQGNRQNRDNRHGGQNGTPKADGKPENQQNHSQAQNGDRHGQNKHRRDDNRNKQKNRDTKPEQNNETNTVEVPESLKTESFFEAPKSDSLFSSTQKDDSYLDSMPPDPTLDEVFGEPKKVEPRTDGTEIVGIHFPQGGKVYYFDPAGHIFEKGQFAIVETARGQELGEVAIANTKVDDSDIVQPLKPVIRQAVKEDLDHQAQNAVKEADALELCKQKVQNHNLDMKLTGAQYTFDNAKLIFYFTAAQRVDFRELVKDLATTFHTRIELRQIGPRDEAKMIGGRGVCGRKLCCSAFLPNYAQSTIKMAKHQGLALNSAKISGNCGKLMCCLKYEESTYEKELALMPTVNSIVETPEGRGRVTDVRPVGYTLRVKLDEKPDAAPKQFRLEDVKTIVRAAEQNDDGDEKGDIKDVID